MKIGLKNCSRPLSGCFFLAGISKVDDIKMKRKVSPFFLSLPDYLPCIALLSLFSARLRGMKAAWQWGEIKVK